MDTKIDQLKQIIPEKYILRQEPMKNHTTFRIGGPADIFVAPENMEEIKAVSRFAKEEGIPLFVLGNGSNLFGSQMMEWTELFFRFTKLQWNRSPW